MRRGHSGGNKQGLKANSVTSQCDQKQSVCVRPPAGLANTELASYRSFPCCSAVKNLPACADVGDVGSIPGSGRSLVEEIVTHSSILAWEIPCTEKPGGLQSMGLQKVRYKLAAK